jgi:hypothetical protein
MFHINEPAHAGESWFDANEDEPQSTVCRCGQPLDGGLGDDYCNACAETLTIDQAYADAGSYRLLETLLQA